MKERRRGPAGGSGDASCPQLDGVGAVPARCHTQHAKARQRGSQRRLPRQKGFKAGQRKRIQQTNNGNEVTDYFTTNSLAQATTLGTMGLARAKRPGWVLRKERRPQHHTLSLSLYHRSPHPTPPAPFTPARIFFSHRLTAVLARAAPRETERKIRSFPSMPKKSLFLFTFFKQKLATQVLPSVTLSDRRSPASWVC